MTTIGEILRQGREAQQRTLKEVAEEAGISVGYLSNLERDRNLPPGPDKLLALARALRLDVHAVFAASGRVHPDVAGLYLARPHEVVRALGPLLRPS